MPESSGGAAPPCRGGGLAVRLGRASLCRNEATTTMSHSVVFFFFFITSPCEVTAHRQPLAAIILLRCFSKHTDEHNGVSSLTLSFFSSLSALPPFILAQCCLKLESFV